MGTAEQVSKYQRIQPFVEIMDSTLRDGEQTSGVSFLPHEKLIIARMLLNDLNVDRIEVASARVSEGEKEAVGMICRFAAKIDKLERVEVLGFIDGGKSVDWVNKMACQGTVEAHVETGGIPNILISIPDNSAYTYGYMIYFFFKACAMSVLMLGVNPFNQPGVEVYKKNMFRLLGKE